MTDAQAGVAAATARAPATRMAALRPELSRTMTEPPIFARNISQDNSLYVQRSRRERFRTPPAQGRMTRQDDTAGCLDGQAGSGRRYAETTNSRPLPRGW